MGEFDNLTLNDIDEIVTADKIDEMRNQVDAWQGLSYLLDSQLDRLQKSTAALATGWRSSAGLAFVDQVKRIQDTLTASRDVALKNVDAWTKAADEATTVRDVINQIMSEYGDAYGKAQTAYNKAAADAKNSLFNNPVTGFLVDQPDPVDVAGVRKPFDLRAQAVLGVASGVYQEVYAALNDVPAYTGPIGATSYGPIDPLTGAVPGIGGIDITTGSGPTPPVGPPITHVQPPHVQVPISDPPIQQQPPVTIAPPEVGPGLVGSITPTLPPPTAPGVTLPPSAGSGGFPGGLPGVFPMPVPTGGFPIPGGLGGKSSLFPELEEPGPSVIGSRQANARGFGGPGESAGTIGPRGAGRGMPGETSGAGLRGGRSFGKGVIGRETPAGGRGRSAGKTRSGGADEDGVIRPARRGAQEGSTGKVTGQRGRKRRDEQDETGTPGDGNELWEVDEGVAAVIEPPARYDASRERPGPHVGHRDERRR
jgi:uncharacterized protein YukE